MVPYSVIITHYQREINLYNTLMGLNWQTFRPSEVIVVEMGDGPTINCDYDFELRTVSFESKWDSMPIAAARNLGARSSSTEQLVFLDVDCIPSPEACRKLVASSQLNNAVVMGQPKYLLHGKFNYVETQELKENSVFHPSRPMIKKCLKEECYELFWSLCFSIPKQCFEKVEGFDEAYCGYGVEDTDFALKMKHFELPFYLSDAEFYHQQHPIYVPPLNHLKSIVHNCNLFHTKWGYWPMADSLAEFSDMGYIDWTEESTGLIRISKLPSSKDISERLVKNAPYR